MKDPGHLQKLGLRAVKPGDGIDVDHGNTTRNAIKTDEFLEPIQIQRQNDEGSHRHR